MVGTETKMMESETLYINPTKEVEKLEEDTCSTDPNSTDPMITEQTSKGTRKGGLRTMPFIIANEAFEKVASFGLLPNMILYLMREYHMSVATGSTVLSLWGALNNFLPLAGAFISDSYLGRFQTIALASFASLFGMTLLWLTTMIPQVRPPHCIPSPTTQCKTATGGQLTLLFTSFLLMSIGAGGIRPCSLAFGADQLVKKNNPKSDTALQSFFNWYYASSAVSVVISLTVLVYIQDHLGWKIGFAVPAIFMIFSAALFMLASSTYIKANANKSLFSGFAQTIVATFRNRHFTLPPSNTHGCYHHLEGSKLTVPTKKLSFLNKACLITNHEKDIKPDGLATNPWSLCTVQQVEELKSLIKVIPLWSTGIMLAVSISTPGVGIILTNTMDRHVTKHFQIPAGSFSMFTIITLTLWICLYDRVILPILVKLTGRPYGLSLKERMGIGLALSCISSAVSAIVEGSRRKTAIKQGFIDNPNGVLDMSAMWLIPSLAIAGLAEAFNAVGQTEFYYSEFPESMSSIATSLFGLGMGFGNLIVGGIVNIVNDVTEKGGKVSWLASNPNRGHYDYYSWLMTILSVINFLYFLVCSWAYGPCEREKAKIGHQGEDAKEGELPKSRELQVMN